MKQGAMGPPPPMGLSRYGSAPGSLLAGIAESVIAAGGGGGGPEFSAVVGSEAMLSRFFPGDSSCLTSESTCRAPSVPPEVDFGQAAFGRGRAAAAGLQRAAYGSGEFHVAASDLAAAAAKGGGGSHQPPLTLQQPATSTLVRHSSSPAGFFSHLVDHGLPATRGIGNYTQTGSEGAHAMANRRLKSQWSFSRQDSLSQISEMSMSDIGDSGCNSSDEATGHANQSYITNNFPLGSWDDTNSIVFSAPPSKRAKDNNGNIITSLSSLDPQFTLPKTPLEMSTVDNYLHMQQDAVACKVRAKRGCATHPRSIAERERRTRISKRLRKLQDLVPNMDKQTNTSDMLELAVQHIKELQAQVQKLKQEQANCTCGCKQGDA